jgi:hypothetical protein
MLHANAKIIIMKMARIPVALVIIRVINARMPIRTVSAVKLIIKEN